MALLAVLFACLGAWQLARLEQKETMIAQVEARAAQAPVPLPPAAEWGAFDPETYNFRPVELTGSFVPANTVLVFTSLANARGVHQGAGYWVMVPFALRTGGTVIVNRGFIPQDAKPLFDSAVPETGTVTLRGIARVSEEPNSFTPGPDIANRVEYVRSLPRLAGMMDPGLAPFAGVYVDLEAGAEGDLPQGGETVMSFPNRHLEYAWTWFSLSALVVLMTFLWYLRQRRG